MQGSNPLLGRSTADIGREGQLARARGVVSSRNPYVRRDRQETTSLIDEAWLRTCSAWWSGWDREDARRSNFGDLHSGFGHSDFQACGPEKSALLKSLGEREPGLCGLRSDVHKFVS